MDSRSMKRRALVCGLLAGCVALLSGSLVRGEEPGLSDAVRQAERILIVSPPEKDKDIDVPAGEQFLIEIVRVLRGSGTKGQLARITQPGDETQHPKFQAGKQYVLLLKKNQEGLGWLSVEDKALPFANGKVTYIDAGGEKTVWPLDEFQTLIAQNPPTKGAVETTQALRTTLEGRWLVGISQQENDFFFWLVEVTKENDKYQAKLLKASKVMEASTLKSFELQETEARLVFEADGQAFEFRGKLDAGIVRGSVGIEDRAVLAARLVATDIAQMTAYDKPKKTPGWDEFKAAATKDEPFAALRDFVRKQPGSPLVLDAYRALVTLSKAEGLDQPKFEELANEYLETAQKWGTRLEVKAQIDIGVTLARTNSFQDLAFKYMDAAAAKLGPDMPASWRLSTLNEKAKLLISSGKEGEGIALLQKLHTENPYEPELTYRLAQQAEKSKKSDEALALYAEISVLPMLERMLMQTLAQGEQKVMRDMLPSLAVQRLWKEKHGDTEKLDEYLDHVYETKLLAIGDEKVPPRPAGEGTRVVLCELFTGAQCPPCVAADVATAGLEATYGKSELIVLRYHQHIPGPDPLANDETQQRFEAYQGQGTPTVIVNGKNFGGGGGFLTNAKGVYQQLRKSVDPVLTEKSSLSLELSAKADKGVISISAKAMGLDKFPDTVRLRMVLAEDKIAFAAGNGIRLHEMVVRSMPGGVDGIEPAEGKLAFENKVDLAGLKSGLLKYLAKLETELAQAFEHKPVDFKALHLVAFLQDADTGEVLQAAAVPVTGTLATAGAAPAKEKPAAKKPAE